jgi:hypothetical protein
MIQGKEPNGQEKTQKDNARSQQLSLIRPLLGAFQRIPEKEADKEYQGNSADNNNERSKVRQNNFHKDLQSGLGNDTARKRENTDLCFRSKSRLSCGRLCLSRKIILRKFEQVFVACLKNSKYTYGQEAL